ncbi:MULTISPECIES: hypothetical protein [Clostridium]|uniref:hypothetical protein n=1 Tax=Clostridium TaxID=1485 RepID=UPI00069F606D|nr:MULTISPECIES: hypothetical protein [Clostridium]KOF56189.1 hypothetical protein AGR56_04620 [Clostridium sp. DMHC 10]MCD2347852.1 hypothetical protein [Clostridium guangxiense]
MFVFILFLIIIGVSAYFILTYSKKIEEQKRKIMVLSRQNKKLKASIKGNPKVYKEIDNIIVKYISSNYSIGIVNCDTLLYIAPIENTFILGKIMEGLNVEVLDECIVNNENWYEIRFHSNQNINNKGWIQEDYITF